MPQTPAPAGLAGSIVLRSVTFKGLGVYDAEALLPLYRDLLGKEVPLTELYAIANRITALYHANGYALSQAFVPGQQVADGAVEIWVVEGAVTSFRIDGDAGGNREVIARYAERILESNPLRTEDLERYLLLMNDLPGASVAAFVAPGERGLQTAELILQAGHKKTGGFLAFDNRGSEFFGPYQAHGNLQANAALGLGELIEIAPMTTGSGGSFESWGGFVNMRLPVYSDGAYLQAYLAASQSEPGGFLEPQDLEGEAFFATLAFGYPILREVDRYLYATIQADIAESREDIFGSQPFIEDSLRVLRGNLNLGQADSWGGETFADIRISLGLDAFGATAAGDPLSSRSNADGGFVAFKAGATRRQSLEALVPGLRLIAGVEGQYSPDPLLAGEEYGLGGPVFLRGYDFYDVAGDYGIAARAEMQYDWRATSLQPVDVVEFFAFYDIGKVWNNDPLSFEPGNASLASAGAGVRTTVAQHLFGSFYVAKPLTRDVVALGDRDLRYFFQLGVTW